MKNDLAVFEGHQIRRVYDEPTETWWFSVLDIMQVLTQQPDFKATQNYWKVLKHRLKKEGSQSVTDCNQLKMPAADGKSYLTDVATAETLLRRVSGHSLVHFLDIIFLGLCFRADPVRFPVGLDPSVQLGIRTGTDHVLTNYMKFAAMTGRGIHDFGNNGRS